MIFPLRGPYLFPVTVALVLSEPLPKPSLCSTAVCLFSVLYYVSVWYVVPQRCLLLVQISSWVFPRSDSLRLFLSTRLLGCFLLFFAIFFWFSYLGVNLAALYNFWYTCVFPLFFTFSVFWDCSSSVKGLSQRERWGDSELLMIYSKWLILQPEIFLGRGFYRFWFCFVIQSCPGRSSGRG